LGSIFGCRLLSAVTSFPVIGEVVIMMFNDNFADTLFFASQKILISISNIVIQMTHNDLSTVVIVLGNTLTL
jgi:hypothetical protein